MVYTLLLSFHEMKGKSNPNKSADITQYLYIYEITITTSSSIAVPLKSTCLSPLLVRPFVFDEVSFSFFLFPQTSQDIQWTLAKASDPEPQLPEGSERSLNQQELGQPGPCRAADIPQVPLTQWELHESHEYHQSGGHTHGSPGHHSPNQAETVLLKIDSSHCMRHAFKAFTFVCFFLKFSHSFVCENATFDNATAFLLQKDESDSMQFVWSRSSLIFYLAFPEAGAQQCLYTCVLRIWSEIKFSDHPSKSRVEADCNAKGNWIPQCFVFYNSYKNITIFSKLFLSFCMHS